ncbi:gp10 [Alphaproteobacteria phage PhiJL001]|uniref:Gp10 n=1 Tax=Alphaproteobacteria phage PhiJL001 TaxID=2681607 RepID=Q5DN95_9CAUD|nr:gp10 [Alphaproteobacteria phage PhiJL001]AAT69486.1 gp10 [Alphaproteobacteria phage PhiJL001]
MWEAEKEVAALEAKLKEAKERLRKYSEETIPNTLEDMGLEEVTVTGGLKVKIRTSVHASPKKENREAVYDWLEKHGHGGLIKRHAIFTVGRDNERQAKSWIKRIKAFPGLFERKVESATLRSFVNQSIEEGTEIPMELFGAYTRRVAEVKSG